MQKIKLWLLVVLIAVLTSWLMLKSRWPSTTFEARDSSTPVRFMVYQPPGAGSIKPSLRPEDSDRLINRLIVQNLVGTLTKKGSSGKREPYLAEKWDVDSSGLTWTFTLQSGLKCEDGTSFGAREFVDNLKRQLRTYAKIGSSGSVLSFDHVIGTHEFLTGKAADIEGLQAEGDHKIIFKFLSRPDSFVQDVGSPYFGYWCPANFVDGVFRSDGRFVSSGSYIVTRISSDTVSLKLRKELFKEAGKIPTEVEIGPLTSSENIGSKVKTIVQAGFQLPDFKDLGNYLVVPGSPGMLTTLKLSPFAPSGFFKSRDQRRLFRKKIFETDLLERLPKNGIRGSHFFFANIPAVEKDLPTPDHFVPAASPIRICLTHTFSEKVINAIQTVITSIFTKMGISNFQFEYVDKNEPNWEQLLWAGKRYDIHVASVDVGDHLVNSQTQVMFCSDLGVSFWDTSGRMCDLVKDYNNNRPIDSTYAERFNKILSEDATVIPFFHSGIVYLYSRDFDPKSIATEAEIYPPFDTLRFVQ